MRNHLWVLAVLIPTPAFGAVLSSDASFGPTTVIESFENIAGRGSNLAIGAPYTFPSGAKLLSPPPRGDSSTAASVNGGFFGMEGGSPLVPDGTAYLGQPNPSLFDNGLTIELPFNAWRVGAFVATSSAGAEGALVIESYSPTGALIESVLTTGVTEQGWKNNFIGFESPTGIRRIRYDGFGGGVLRIDKLEFQPLPEPSAAAVVMVAAACGMLRRRRGRR
jgi:hypothetical protein